jgi:putative SOS response-associated peptidase YedK
MSGRHAAPHAPLDGSGALAQLSLWQPTYNAAPTDRLPVIVAPDGHRRFELMQWGLVPHWARDPRIGARLIHARAESAADKPAFRLPLRRQRCLVPASGFYAWEATKEGKLPYLVRRKDGDLFAVAGLYDTWRDAMGRPLRGYAILTTAANRVLLPFQDRMPAILPYEAEAVWLDPAVQDVARLTALLRPYPAEELEVYPVSRRVNSVKHNDARLLDLVENHAEQPS